MSLKVFPMTIDGQDVVEGQSIEVINPATAKPFAVVPECTKQTLDAAVAAARKAQPLWSRLSFEERRSRVAALGVVLQENMDPLMRLLTEEQGKPHEESTGEILGSAYWFAGSAELVLPVDILEDSSERLSVTHRVPIGVVAAILPWNFPVLVFAFKVIPALLAGNTVIAKPSPFTPLTTLYLGKLLQKSLPPGVLNIISGSDELGAWMTAHPGIDKVAFTGSTATGKKIIKSAADTVKRVSLELGGNDPAIVMSDVDIVSTAEGVFWGAFRNAGQICVATKRVYVHEAIYDRFFQALVAYAALVKVGDGATQGSQLGPIQNKAQYDRVKGLAAECVEAGFPVHTASTVPDEGYFFPVTLVDNPPDDASIVVEEQFGPILPVLRFKDIDDVVARANNSPYGLAASVWSKDLNIAQAIAAKLDCGNVWINTVQDSPLSAPIAGHKQSGLGAENGLPGLLEYTNLQTITLKRQPAA